MYKVWGDLEVKRQGRLKRSTTKSRMRFYVIMCDAWDYEVLKCFIMILNGSICSLVKFGGQTTKNVQGSKDSP